MRVAERQKRTYKKNKNSERTVKSTGISPVRAYDSGKKPRVAPERSDLSSRWQKMIPTLRDKGKPSFKFAIFLWIMPRSPKRNKKQSNYMHLLQNIVFLIFYVQFQSTLFVAMRSCDRLRNIV